VVCMSLVDYSVQEKKKKREATCAVMSFFVWKRVPSVREKNKNKKTKACSAQAGCFFFFQPPYPKKKKKVQCGYPTGFILHCTIPPHLDIYFILSWLPRGS
jgi:hypothetical protein